MSQLVPAVSLIVLLVCNSVVASPSSLTPSEATPEVKYILHSKTTEALTPDDVAALRARTLAAYDTMHAVAVPEHAREAFLRRVAALGHEAVELEDVIRTPRVTIATKVRQPCTASTEPGLFIVQYVAPATEAWQAAVRTSGAVFVAPLPERAVLLAAEPEQIADLARRPWVQYARAYDSSSKYSPSASPDHTEFTLQVADVPASAPAVAAIRHRVGGFFDETRHGAILTTRFTADLATALSLLSERFVIGVEAFTPMEASDERQSLSLTTAEPPASQTTRYLAWLAAPGRDITPNKLTESNIVVDIADTGVDNGCGNASSRHPDLAGRTVYHNGATPLNSSSKAGSNRNPRYHDNVGHGTIVAGIVGGNPTAGIDTGFQPTQGLGMEDDDTGRFYYGLGVAPGIRFGNTVMMEATQVGTVAGWTTLAVTQDCVSQSAPCPAVPSGFRCAATVQNHSNNEYTDTGTKCRRIHHLRRTVRHQRAQCGPSTDVRHSPGHHLRRG